MTAEHSLTSRASAPPDVKVGNCGGVVARKLCVRSALRLQQLRKAVGSAYQARSMDSGEALLITAFTGAGGTWQPGSDSSSDIATAGGLRSGRSPAAKQLLQESYSRFRSWAKDVLNLERCALQLAAATWPEAFANAPEA